MEPATMVAAGTAGSGLIQGLLGMEAEKRKLAWEKQKLAQQRRDARYSQVLGAMQQQAALPVQQAQAEANVYQNLIAALGGIR